MNKTRKRQEIQYLSYHDDQYADVRPRCYSSHLRISSNPYQCFHKSTHSILLLVTFCICIVSCFYLHKFLLIAKRTNLCMFLIFLILFVCLRDLQKEKSNQTTQKIGILLFRFIFLFFLIEFVTSCKN